MRKQSWRYLSARNTSILFAILSMSLFVMAFQAVAAPAAAAAAPSMLSLIGKNALMGVVAALIGWGAQKKAADGTHEDWDFAQLPLTVLVGAGFGVYASLSHSTLADAENQAWVPLVIAGLENVVKLIFRNAKVSVAAAFTAVKGGEGSNPTGSAPGTSPKA